MNRDGLSKDGLLKKIQEAGFAIVDLNLFLDSHPDNKMALDFFRDVQEQYAALRKEYEKMCGPLTVTGTNTEQGWTWIQNPWPWELEA